MTKRSRPSLTTRILTWLQSVLGKPQKAEEPKEIVKRSLVLSGKQANLAQLNQVQEIEDSDPWSLVTFKLTPLKYGPKATVPSKSTKEFWYLFLHNVPMSKRGATVSYRIAGKTYSVKRGSSQVFGPWQISVVFVGDRANQSTWQFRYQATYKFRDDRAAKQLMEQLGRKLLTRSADKFNWMEEIEALFLNSDVGTTPRQHQRNLNHDPFQYRG